MGKNRQRRGNVSPASESKRRLVQVITSLAICTSSFVIFLIIAITNGGSITEGHQSQGRFSGSGMVYPLILMLILTGLLSVALLWSTVIAWREHRALTRPNQKQSEPNRIT